MSVALHSIEPVIGHGNSVTWLAFSPKGEALASTSFDRRAILWDVKTGNPLRTLTHRDGVSEVSFSPDGCVLATATYHEISLWKPGNSRRIRRLPGGHPVAFSRDGKLLATMGEHPETVQLWEVTTGETILRLARHRPQVQCLTFSPAEDLLAVGDWSGMARVWQAWTGKVIWTLRPSQHGINALAFSPDGTRLAAGLHMGGARGTTSLMVWDVPARRLMWQAGDGEGGCSETFCVAFSPEGRQLTTGHWDGTVKVWDAESGALLHKITGRHWVRAVTFSPDGTLLASAGDDKLIYLRDTNTWNLVQRLGGWFGKAKAVAVSQKGAQIVSGYEDGTVRLWNTRTGRLQRVITQHPNEVRCLSLTRDGQRLASSSWSWNSGCSCQVLEIRSGCPVRRRTVGDGRTTVVAFSPDGTLLATGDPDGAVTLQDAESGRLLRSLPALPDTHGCWVGTCSIAFSPDGTLIAVNYANKVGLWEVAAGTLKDTLSYPLEKEYELFVSLAFSPDGKWLAAGCMGFRLTLWHLSRADRCRVLGVHADSVGAVAFSPDSTLLAVGTDYEETIALWHVQKGRRVKQLHGHRAAIRALAFLPDGRLVSGSADGTVRVWDVATGEWTKAMLVLPPREGDELSTDWITFAPEGAWAGSRRAKEFVMSTRNTEISGLVGRKGPCDNR